MKGEFAEKLEAAVKESGISVSKLSALSGLGRTAIQHVMSGDFLPTRAFLDKLLSCFPLPAEQHREITELYIMEKIGRKQYMSNIRIAQMLEDIPDFYRAELQAVNVTATPISIKSANGIITENGLMNVLTLCSHLFVDEIMREDPYMVITVPFSCKEYFNSLIHTMNGINKPIRIDHFGRFFTTDDSYLNFEKLSSALKFSLRPEIEYTPYYYYSKSTSGAQLNNLIIPYPYYIATRSYVILIGEDMNNAVMIRNEDIVAQVLEHTAELKKRCMPVYRMIGENEIANIVYAQKTGVMSLSYQALFTNVIPYEILKEKLYGKYRTSEYADKLMRYYSMNPSSKCISYMSADGLMQFAKTGRIMNAPDAFFTNFTALERIKILESCKCCDNFCLIDPAALAISNSVKLYSLSTKTVVIVVSNPDSSIFCRIDESILVDGLNAFFASLDKTGFLLDTEHKNAEIDRCIEAARACTDPS